MPVKIIPDGASAVVTEKDRRYRGGDRDIIQNTYVADDRDRYRRDFDDGHNHILRGQTDIIQAVKDADAHVSAFVKDAEANLGTAMGTHFAGTLSAVKDAQADLERSGGLHFAGTLEAVKDAEAQIQKASGDYYADTVKTVKDVEAQMERSAGTRYADIVKEIKDTESDLERADALTRDAVRQAELTTEKAKASVIDVLREVQYENCKGFDDTKEEVQAARKELLFSQTVGFKDTLIEFKNKQNIMNQLAAAAEKTACQNQMQTLLQFKEAQLLAEKNAYQASRELAECCCELKELIHSDGQKTRDLINLQEVDRLRERASKAEQQLALLNLQIGCGVPLAK